MLVRQHPFETSLKKPRINYNAIEIYAAVKLIYLIQYIYYVLCRIYVDFHFWIRLFCKTLRENLMMKTIKIFVACKTCQADFKMRYNKRAKKKIQKFIEV